MPDYIKREEAIQRIRQLSSLVGFEDPASAISSAIVAIARMPGTNTVPAQHGKLFTGMTLDGAIQYCHEVAESSGKINPCDTYASEYEQLARWLEELKKLRVECDGLRSNWYKCAEKVKTLRAERDAAVSDLRKLVPAWKWDGENEQISREESPKCGRVEFG